MAFLAVRIINNPAATHYTRRYLTDLGHGLLVGDLTTRTRRQLIDYLTTNTPPGDYIAAWPDPNQPQRWTTLASTPSTAIIDGITITKITNQ
jgi:hypothetical protein